MTSPRPALRRYLRSCLWLTFPALAFNLALYQRLPAAFHGATFWRDIPAVIARPEQVLRVLVFAAPTFMRLAVDTPRRRAGLALYLGGSLAYAAAWGALIAWPTSAWSTSAVGFAAPAYTPALWLLGIALIGDQLFVWARYRWWMYGSLAAAFVLVHVAHTLTVFARL